MRAKQQSLNVYRSCAVMGPRTVRGAHVGIKPGGVSPREGGSLISLKPAERAKDFDSQDPITRDCDSPVARFAGLRHYLDRDPGAHAPGFMPSCAPRTLLLRIAKIARLTPSIVGSDEF